MDVRIARSRMRPLAFPSLILMLAAIVAIAAGTLVGCRPSTPWPAVEIPAPPAGVEDLNAWLETVRRRHGLPGVVAAAFNSEGLVAIGAAGTRKLGTGVPLVYTDKLPIASIAKTMTATITAQLIEEGQLSWEATLAELYPELADGMHPGYRTVTVDMLLRHTAGLPRWMRHDDVVKDWVRRHRTRSNPEKRFEAVRHILNGKPEYPPGTRAYYTNDAYLILGNICERATGKSCEDLFRERLFAPLQMESSGFGEPWSDGSVNHPWGHVQRGARFVPYDPDPAGYGAIPFTTPYGGGVHGSVVDLARYGAYHLRGDIGLESVPPPATFRRLHHAPAQTVAPGQEITGSGFFNAGRLDSEGRWTTVHHWGYHARGRTLWWFSPQANIGVVILTNGTDEDEGRGMQPLLEILRELDHRYRSGVPGNAGTTSR